MEEQPGSGVAGIAALVRMGKAETRARALVVELRGSFAVAAVPGIARVEDPVVEVDGRLTEGTWAPNFFSGFSFLAGAVGVHFKVPLMDLALRVFFIDANTDDLSMIFARLEGIKGPLFFLCISFFNLSASPS